ncbi:MAG: T9SS type A sorting domain-containing protein [Crocinitomicaceae bacterium]
MKTNFTKLSLLIAVLFVGFSSNAQTLSSQVIGSSGGFYSKTTGSLSFTTGEAATLSLKNGSLLLSQGFQKAQDDATSIFSVQKGQIKAELYPNPASDFIDFTVTTPGNSRITIDIFNVLGAKVSTVESIQSSGSKHTANKDVSELSDGIYFATIRVTDLNSNAVTTLTKKFTINK